ncbi:response regulator transcription factor [Methylocapsa aurea]|uniref:response regulator transcription factor n=1 Tax=Methylocapsa aurea TaxID=663610 RepID=UPI00192E4268|nr:response regulator transcription factor [Methylocapsa aurea]
MIKSVRLAYRFPSPWMGSSEGNSDIVTSMRHLLVIEDDPDIAEVLRVNLRDEGFVVDHAADGERGLHLIEIGSYDLIVLDLMLPGVDGFDICRQVRLRSEYTPIVITSAKSAEAHRILGLELGADDYLTKPFSVLELAARIRALFRRIDRLKIESTRLRPAMMRFGELCLDVAAREVSLSGCPVILTPREFDLLYFFAQHPNRVFTRLELLDQVWGYSHDGYEHTVNSHINRLRSKIEPEPANPTNIVTVWGVGYKFRHSLSLSASRP